MEKIVNINEMAQQNLFNRGGGSAVEYIVSAEHIGHMNNMNQMNPAVGPEIAFARNPESMNCNPGLGICSVPMQEWEQVYDEDTGFSAGTIFPCLNKPFLGGGK